MKIFLVKAKYKVRKRGKELSNLKKLLKKYDKNQVFIFYTIQYAGYIDMIKREINKSKVKLVGIKQLVGCNCIALKPYDFCICICDGKFHALSIIKTQLDNVFRKLKNFDILEHVKPVYVYSPIVDKFSLINKEEIKKLIRDLKARWFNFNKANNYGIIVSVKPGQENFDLAIMIKERIKKHYKKNCYLFLSNEVDINQFSNFNIDFWIITACPQFSIEGNKNLCNISEFYIFDELLKNGK